MINVGWGADLPIRELTTLVADVVGFRGQIVFDSGKPDGTPRKPLEGSRLKGLGWSPKIPLREGLQTTYDWYLQNLNELRT